MAEQDTVTLIGRLDDGSYVVRHADGRLERQQDQTDRARLERMKEAEIEAGATDDPDNPPLDAAFFTMAEPVALPRKRRVTIMLDSDVIAHFGAGGRGYQTRINMVLRRYVEAQRK